jgi:hypothetical protein
MMTQPSEKITTSGRQPFTQMSIAYLLDPHDKTEPVDFEGTRENCDSVSTPSQTPVAHSGPRIPTCDQIEMAEMLFNTNSAHLDLPYCPYGHYPSQARSVESTIDISSPSSGHASSSWAERFGYRPISPGNDSPTSPCEPSSSVDRSEPYYRHCCHDHHAQVYISAAVPTRKPRSARLSYNEEQKFFIMCFRIVKQLSWPEIEDRFAQLFHLRSKGGLSPEMPTNKDKDP